MGILRLLSSSLFLSLFCSTLLSTYTNAGVLPPRVVLTARASPPSIKASSYTIQTKLGRAKGVPTSFGAARFTLPYAAPPLGPLRFANPQSPAPFANGSTYDATRTPPSCYGDQGARGGNDPSEDCLYVNVFAPESASSASNLKVLVWVHGGSFIGGSATAAGLDASKLATVQNIVVVVLQYRLGLFGFFQTGATLDETNGGGANGNKVAGNQGVRDVVAALSFIKANAASFGGNGSAITIAGQSSGAHLIRALLTTPSASSLFQRAALFSDTGNYGLSNATQAAYLTNYALTGLGCSTSDLACARSKSADDILGATFDAFSNLPPTDPSMPVGEPFRPVRGSYIPRSLERTPSLISTSKPLLFATVKNEAGSQAGSIFDESDPGASTLTLRANGFPLDLPTAASLVFNAGRGYTAASSATYALNSTTRAPKDALRSQLELIATDGLWRCAVQQNAISTKNVGAKVYLAQTNIGSTYPSNAQIDYCQKAGVVCHEDDIFLLFGSYPTSSSAAIKAVSTEWQVRLGAFVRTGSPNKSGSGYGSTQSFSGWAPVGSANALNLLVVGGANASTGQSNFQASQRKGVCGTTGGLWGKSVQFDWQIYPA